MIRHTVALVGLGLMLAGCASGRFGPNPDTEAPKGPHTLKQLSLEERQQVLQRAHVWQEIATSSLNLIQGPALPAAMRIGRQTTCTFVFPSKPLTGLTPKFRCALPPSPGLRGASGTSDEVKVKYGEKNGEVYAEVAGSRLLWALGFKADVMVPTQVTCRNCPADPFAASTVDWQRGSPSEVSTRVFEPAIIEREVVGKAVEVPGYEGWAWPELDQIRERGGPSTPLRAGGATRAQIDAFKLFAVFIQHSDSKPDQQEIVCAEWRKDARGNETCAAAWLVIKDLGGSFGKATRFNTSKMTLADWDGAGVWKDGPQCVGNLPRSVTGTLDDPAISEAGRRFLARRLNLLRDRQIRDLFTVSQVEKRGEEIAGADGRKRPVTVDDWVRVFKRKRAEITSARCPA